MAEKLVRGALDHARAGQLDRALMTLDTAAERASRGFVLKRLDHLAKHGGADAQHAIALRTVWAAPSQSQAAPAEDAAPDDLRRDVARVGAPSPSTLALEHPESFLAWASSDWSSAARLSSLPFAQMWALVGMASLALPGRVERPPLDAGLAVRSGIRFLESYALGG